MVEESASEAAPEATPARAVLVGTRTDALLLIEKIDDGLRRLVGFHSAGDLASASAVANQLAAFYASLKTLIE